MFQKNNRRDGTDPSVDTVVSSGTSVEGQLRVEGNLRIDGRLNGNLAVNGILLVGPQAEIRADIEAVEARVSGKIRGNLKARESVELLQGSRLEGDVFTKCFRIEDGAFFQGNCHMGEAYLDEVGDRQGMMGR